MAVLDEISSALIAGDAGKVRELTEQALAQGIAPGKVIKEGFVPGMEVVGEKFRTNEFYVPEVLIAARAMKAGLAIVKPLLSDAEVRESLGKVVIGTVKGDLHDIGKNLVAMMLEGAGFEIVDLGVDVSPEKFVAAVQEHNPNFVCLSALLTTTMVSMRDTIQALKEKGLRDQVRVLVGGAPVTENFAAEIGADGYAPDSTGAVELAKSFLN